MAGALCALAHPRPVGTVFDGPTFDFRTDSFDYFELESYHIVHTFLLQNGASFIVTERQRPLVRDDDVRE